MCLQKKFVFTEPIRQLRNSKVAQQQVSVNSANNKGEWSTADEIQCGMGQPFHSYQHRTPVGMHNTARLNTAPL